MYGIIYKELESRTKPIDVIMAGLGFMGFGFFSSIQKLPGIRVPLILSRRPQEAMLFLSNKGFKVKLENNPKKIREWANLGYICVSNDLQLIKTYENEVVFEVTGTVEYGTEIALKTLYAKKHLITMNPELQVTVGTELKMIADKNKVIISDVIGDQPGSLTRLMAQAKLMGFTPVMAGNMKRYMDQYANQEKMKPWADDKGLNVRQTTSFTDGTKQSIEMNLVSNYFGMTILQDGMVGPKMEDIKDVLKFFDFDKLPNEGVVDYALGLNLLPGVFIVAKHTDPNQQKYLRYLNMGEGPYYMLFDSYHLCHLEAVLSILKAVLYKEETINNGLNPKTKTVAIAKINLKKDQILDGIGGDTVYGLLKKTKDSEGLLPVGFAIHARLKRSLKKDEPIKITDVELPNNVATRLAGLVKHEAPLHNFPHTLLSKLTNLL